MFLGAFGKRVLKSAKFYYRPLEATGLVYVGERFFHTKPLDPQNPCFLRVASPGSIFREKFFHMFFAKFKNYMRNGFLYEITINF